MARLGAWFGTVVFSLLLVAVGLVTLYTAFVALVFANSQEDQIPEGTLQLIVWFALAGVAVTSLVAATGQALNARRRAAAWLLAGTVAANGAFWGFAYALPG